MLPSDGSGCVRYSVSTGKATHKTREVICGAKSCGICCASSRCGAFARMWCTS